MKEYYFKYTVTGHQEEEYNTLKEARREAGNSNEAIYLMIFSRLNSYGEPYDEEEVNKATSIRETKQRLIKSFNELTN